MPSDFEAPRGLPHDPDIPPGAVIDRRYRVVRLLGKGGMGAVYEAEHVLVRRRVALKLLHPALSRDPEVARRFHREALASSAIGHPNIVEVQDMGHLDDGAMYMVLELLRGRDWGEDIDATGPQPLGRVARIVTQLCAALGAAHDVGIVHRDLKPENVFLCPRSSDPFFVKVLDFGISKFKDSIHGEQSGLTSTGVALGTPFFMPPEQLEGKRHVDHRADVYALGVAAYHALAGEYPFHAHTLPALLLKVTTAPPDPIAAYRPGLPPPLTDGLERMLAKDPDARPQRCDEVAALFAPYLDLEPGELPPTPPVTSAPPPLAGPPVSGHEATRPSVRPRRGAPDGATRARAEGDAATRARPRTAPPRSGARPVAHGVDADGEADPSFEVDDAPALPGSGNGKRAILLVALGVTLAARAGAAATWSTSSPGNDVPADAEEVTRSAPVRTAPAAATPTGVEVPAGAGLPAPNGAETPAHDDAHAPEPATPGRRTPSRPETEPGAARSVGEEGTPAPTREPVAVPAATPEDEDDGPQDPLKRIRLLGEQGGR